jgi:hypothetical protein
MIKNTESWGILVNVSTVLLAGKTHYFNKGYFIPARKQIWYLSNANHIIITHIRTNGEVSTLLTDFSTMCFQFG